MAFRFPAEASETVVRELWMEIVEGRSQLWTGIGEDKKECIRGEFRPAEQRIEASESALMETSISIPGSLSDSMPPPGP